MVRKPANPYAFKRARAAPKAIKPVKATNPYGAAQNRDLALAALRGGVRLTLTYENLMRVVDVYTIGLTTRRRPAMSAFQVDGYSHSFPMTDWRLFCFDECFDVSVTNIPRSPTHPDYKKGAKQFIRIDAEL